MIQEVLTRRIKHGDFPDLIIIDGGKGQLSKAREVLEKMNLLNINLISISKGKKEMQKMKDFIVSNGREVFRKK